MKTDNTMELQVNGNGVVHAEKGLNGSEQGPPPAEEHERGQWGSKAEFVLSCIGLSVGLGNVWRFPYLAYKNGGAAFVIAYLILQLLIGKPMYMLELVIGQFSNRGPTAVWAMNPCAKGIGISMAIISLDVAIYYNVIMAYTLFFFFASMQSVLPWTVCRPEWTDCVEKRGPALPLCSGNLTADMMTLCHCPSNVSVTYMAATNCTNTTYIVDPKTPSEFYFKTDVIQRSAGLEPENMGAPLWKLTMCLILSWVIVLLCLIKGVKSSGKVVYFTATFPYVILLILLIRGATLDGAIDGVIYFIVPKWEKLANLEVWVAAAGQMFFSLGVSFGGIIMYGSYNKFRNNIYFDAMLISIMDLVTSIIAGFVIFTTFGGMAKQVGGNTTVENIVKEPGYGLAFVAYPEALANLPPAQLWSILFFFMLFTLGLDSEFAMLETVLTCVYDEFPTLRPHKAKLCVGLGVVCFFLALPCVCPGGDYVVGLMDSYGADFSLLCVACVECISVMWVYGVRRFLKDMSFMLGHTPRLWPFWGFCWTVTSPILVGLLFAYRMATFKGATYPDGRFYPTFALIIGWVLLGIVLIPIPLYFVYQLVFKAKGGIKQRLRESFRPSPEWGPAEERESYFAMLQPQPPVEEEGFDNLGIRL